MDMTSRPLGQFGTTIVVDGHLPDRDRLRSTLEEKHLVRLRGLPATAETLSAAADLLGEIKPFRNFASLPQYPGITEVQHEPEAGRQVLGGSWHSDLSFLLEPPQYGLVLGVETPNECAATLFASRPMALNRLSVETVCYFESLSCIFSGRHVYGRGGVYDSEATRPQAIVPDRHSSLPDPIARGLVENRGGVRTLTFDPGYCTSISPLPEAESFAVWRWLESIVTDWDVVTQIVIERGDLIVWDNSLLLHRAPTAPRGPRRILRTNVWTSPTPRWCPSDVLH